MDTRKTALIKNSQGDPVGTTHSIKVVKNKVGPPFKKCAFSMRFGEGISRAGEVIDLGLTTGLILTKGSFYYVQLDGVDTPIALGQGREKAVNALAKDTELMQKCVALLKQHKLSKTEMPSESDEPNVIEEADVDIAPKDEI